MKTLKLTITVLAIVFTTLVTAQEKVKEVKSYRTETDIKIKKGMYFTILDGEHNTKRYPNFWLIPGGGRLPNPLKHFSFIYRGTTFKIQKVLKVTGKNVEKHYLIQFNSLHGRTYLQVDQALKDQEIMINTRMKLEEIAKI